MMTVGDIVRGIKLKCGNSLKWKAKLGMADLGILKVALMVAALDGEVTEDEYKAFDALAKKCRGYTPENAKAALDEAMRSAGYLLLLANRVKTTELVKAFVAEARAALPEGFAYCSIEDVRRAFVIWTVVGMSDGTYSEREHACINALRKEFAELAIRRADEEDERWRAFTPSLRMAYGKRVVLVGENFVSRVEALASQYSDTAAAHVELQNLIDGQP